MKESYSYKQLEDRRVQCLTCAQRCFILSQRYGLCGVRKNIDGRLYALNYGKIISQSIDPVEKKPLFHFLPGSNTYSFATVGCNLACGNCQNWQISQTVKSDKVILEMGDEVTPERIVEAAMKNDCPSISYTYTEPTIFLEFALDTMKIAKKRGVKNIWVSNGFMTAETLDLVLPYLDAANIDIKSSEDEFYRKHCMGRLEPILENCIRIKKAGIWLEITTLVIPGISSDEEVLENIANFIKVNLGYATPWHLSAFSGQISWKMRDIPETTKEQIHTAYHIGKKAGLRYVYAGNLPGDLEENTYCPRCGELNIERTGYKIKRYDKHGECRNCGEDLDLVLR
jgi:pyruvate formate lyase activating enzyme